MRDAEGIITKLKSKMLCVSGGFNPDVHLFTQSGGKLKFRDEDQVFIPNIYPSKQISIGSCNGDFELDKIIKNSSYEVKNFLEEKRSQVACRNVAFFCA